MYREYRALPRSVQLLCLGSLINRAGSFAIIFLTVYASEALGYGVAFASACLGMFGLGSIRIRNALHLSHLQYGMLMSINGIMIFLLQFPMTHWLSRHRSMKVMTAGGVLIEVGFGLCAIPGGFWYLALTVLVWTLREIFEAPFHQSIVTELAPAVSTQ